MLERPETLTDFKEGPVTEPLCKDEFCTDNGCPNNPLTKRHEISIDGKNYTTEGPVEPIEPAADLSALDVVDKLRERLSLLPDVPCEQELTLFAVVMKGYLAAYELDVAANAIAVDNLTEEKASDKELQKVAHKYSITMNQVVAYMDMCEQVNTKMHGTGMVVVPFWFHEQYLALQEMNKELIAQTDSLMQTLSNIESKPESALESIGVALPKRTNIITGSTIPYIVGETGPRIGDEHLDTENVYIDPKLGRAR